MIEPGVCGEYSYHAPKALPFETKKYETHKVLHKVLLLLNCKCAQALSSCDNHTNRRDVVLQNRVAHASPHTGEVVLREMSTW